VVVFSGSSVFYRGFNLSEKSEAKRDGARLQKNSGRGQYQKSDAKLGDLSIDYKEYEKSFSISRDVWGKVCTDAAKNGLDYNPVIKVVLGEGMSKVRLAVVAWDYFEYLKEIERGE
jgi:hypothetical protein